MIFHKKLLQAKSMTVVEISGIVNIRKMPDA
jgi:hypothetical protein